MPITTRTIWPTVSRRATRQPAPLDRARRSPQSPAHDAGAGRAWSWLSATADLVAAETEAVDTTLSRPAVISLCVADPPVSSRCYAFSEAPAASAWLPPRGITGDARTAPPRPADWSRASRTPIRPPGDVIKLADRLFYVLQPSIEMLLGAGTLSLPHRPFPYQLAGVSFLYPRHAAILADEMGLGKTMQAITALRLLLHAGEVRSVLLICPKPLISNWQRELQLWAPEIPAAVISGGREQRRWQWRMTEIPVRIANYELLNRDRDVACDVPCDLVLLDEAQRIKNTASATSQVVRALPRRRSWALTGTPIENSCEDLVGIFEFVSAGVVSRHMTPRHLAQAARDYILRRTKDHVLRDLPPKLFRDAELGLTDAQRASYDLVESQGVVRLNEMGDQITVQHVFELILRLKQICNFDPATGESSKLERLEADLEEIAASGQKAIVFSQWVQTLQHLASSLARFQPLQYHGRIPAPRRDDVIRRFRDGIGHHVLLMSYGAGSVGLNLQFAGYVFLFDRWWNPAVEDQAINRAHRIGAAGPVTVTRFLTLGTIEQRIDEILRAKRDLVAAVLNDSGQPRNLGLTQDEIFGLFPLQVR
jgi:SNF2 family DNA or RNA helicase